jgi:hypothetical protein
VSALPVAEGPADYFGGSIMSFALPMAAFIVIAGLLFYLYRRPHHNPRLKYMAPEVVTSVGTLEPGPIPAPAPAPKAAADAVPETVAPETVAPETTEAESGATDSASEGKE